MNAFDIQKHIVEILTQNSFNAVASEVKEGFAKPAVFVSVHPIQHERLMCGMEQVTDSVEIKFFPSVETAAECIKTSDKIIDIFYYSPFRVEGHTFTVESIETNIEDYILTVNFELTYEQPMPDTNEYANIENMDMNMNIKTEVE